MASATIRQPRRTAGGVEGAKRFSSASRPALGKNANRSSPPRPRKITKLGSTPGERRERRNAKRRERYTLRHDLRALTGLERIKKCGHIGVTGDGTGPTLRVGPGKRAGERIAGFSGLSTCGSVWACPVCSAKIATRRAEELADLMRWSLEQGCSASMVTLTMRHHKGQTLQDCWRALSKSWARVTSGKQWVNDQAAAGLQGWVKAVEVTNGKNGWHVHLHVLMIWRGSISQDMADHVGGRMHARWTRGLQSHGFDSLRDSGGLDVRLASLDPGNAGTGLHEYFVKLSHEITGGQGKLAKGGGRTPFQILTDGLLTGLADDLELWLEWEHASKGKRQIAWSQGLREWAKLMPEQSDEEIAQEDTGGEDILGIDADGWRWLRARPSLVCQLLEATEEGGFVRATALLDTWGVGWVRAKRAPKLAPFVGPTMTADQLLREINAKLGAQRLTSWGAVADSAVAHGFQLMTPGGKAVTGTRRR